MPIFKTEKVLSITKLTLLIFIAAILLAGCARNNGGAETGAQASRTGSDTIIAGLPWEPRTLNPYRGLDSASYFAQSLVHGSLMRYDGNGQIKPALARDATISPDGLSYTFNLRENLKFSDGSPVTANDVVASIEATRGAGSPFRNNLEAVRDCRATAPLQVVLHLSSRNLPLMSRMTDLRIVPAAFLRDGKANSEDLARRPVGCGPFRLYRWDAGLELVFEANPNYYGEKARSRFIIWRIIPDGNLLSAALRRGDVDVARIDGRADIDLLSKSTGLRVEDFRSARTIFLAFNTEKEPYSRDEFRQAIAMLINKQAIAKNMYRGYAQVPATDFPPTLDVFDRKARLWPFNPVAARALLAKCGFEERSDGWYRSGGSVVDVGVGSEIPNAENERLSFKIITIRDFIDVAQVVAADLQNAKIGVRVEIVEYSTMKDKYLSKGNFDCVLFSRTQGPDPDCRLTWAKNGPLNYARFKDDELDRLVNEGYYAGSEAERRDAYMRVQTLLANRLPFVYLVQPDLTVAHKAGISGLGQGLEKEKGLPWDNPLFDAAAWVKEQQ